MNDLLLVIVITVNNQLLNQKYKENHNSLIVKTLDQVQFMTITLRKTKRTPSSKLLVPLVSLLPNI